MPSSEAIGRYRRLFATGEKVDGSPAGIKAGERAEASNVADRDLLVDILSKATKSSKASYDRQTTRLIRGRFFIYRYDPAKRTEDHPAPTPNKYVSEQGLTSPNDQPLSGAPPKLPLPPVPKSIQAGDWYLVAELIVSLSFEGRPMNWRMLVEVETEAILYIRALISPVDGLIFAADPITLTGNAANSPVATAATLDPIRSTMTLLGLTAPDAVNW
jgi:hypothetical protein